MQQGTHCSENRLMIKSVSNKVQPHGLPGWLPFKKKDFLFHIGFFFFLVFLAIL